MLPTTIRTPPEADAFVPLDEYQSQTPTTFFGGKPILHFHAAGAKLWIDREQRARLPIFPADCVTAPSGPEGKGAGEELVEQPVDVFVNTENLTLFNTQAEVGVQIPYPTISIHALKRVGPAENRTPCLWMQLELSDGGSSDEDFNTVELTLIPPSPTDMQKLYAAVSTCSDLHPDPVDEDEDGDYEDDRIVFESSAGHEALEGFSGVMMGASDGTLPMPLPGSSGWITADNAHEYFDKDGNWIKDGGEAASGELGDGAGRVRTREELYSEAEVNGQQLERDGEVKRHRAE